MQNIIPRSHVIQGPYKTNPSDTTHYDKQATCTYTLQIFDFLLEKSVPIWHVSFRRLIQHTVQYSAHTVYAVKLEQFVITAVESKQ